MRIVFAGGESIGFECLRVLVEERHDVVGVLVDTSKSQYELENRRVKTLARQAGLDLWEVQDVNHPAVLDRLTGLRPDVLFNVAFLQIYKAPVLAIPTAGCINFHPGPLPKYGGSNGWVWAILNGERDYGIAFHYMKERVDAGDLVGYDTFPINEDETGLSLLVKCYKRGAPLFRKTLRSVVDGTLRPESQDLALRSYYYNKIPFEGMIDVTWTAARIRDFVRALTFSPFPNPLSPPMVAFAGTRLMVTKASVVEGDALVQGRPGEVVDVGAEGVVIRAGEGFVALQLSDRSTRSADTVELSAVKGIVRGSTLGS